MNKKAFSPMETVLTFLVLMILFWVVLSVYMPKIKLSKYNDCLESHEITCISKQDFYSVGSVCRKDGLLTEQKCEDKGDVCCRLTYEESEKRKTLAEQSTIQTCEDTKGNEKNIQCLCNSNTGSGKIDVMDLGDDLGQVSFDCTGHEGFVRFSTGKYDRNDELKKLTSYCMDVSDNQGLLDNIKTKLKVTEDSVSTFYCLEKHPNKVENVKLEYNDIIVNFDVTEIKLKFDDSDNEKYLDSEEKHFFYSCGSDDYSEGQVLNVAAPYFRGKYTNGNYDARKDCKLYFVFEKDNYQVTTEKVLVQDLIDR